MDGGCSQTRRAGCGNRSRRRLLLRGALEALLFPASGRFVEVSLPGTVCTQSTPPEFLQFQKAHCGSVSKVLFWWPQHPRLPPVAGFSWESLPHRHRLREKRKEGRREVGRKNSALGTDRRRPGFLWGCGLQSGVRGCYPDSPPHALQPRLGVPRGG